MLSENQIYKNGYGEESGGENNDHEVVIRVSNISKCYEIYEAPRDRLKQFVLPAMQRITGLPPKKYFREFWALSDVSFEIGRGESVGIVGRNGSGKSTLLQLICGTIAPTNGCVETKGRIAALLELGSGFNPEFSGKENVFMNATVLGLTRDEIEKCYEDIVEFADIGDFIDQPVKSYSSGMMVRLAFAVSVFVEPEILVVDEALAVGDAVFQFKCLERLKHLTKSGTTLLFVSHDIQMVKGFCDRAIYLHKGKVKAEGRSEDVAEIYIMDVHDEQQNQANGSKAVIAKKQYIGNGSGVAFGTSEGRITGAHFLDVDEVRPTYEGGEVALFEVELEYDGSLENPYVTAFLQDSKLIGIGGKSIPLKFQKGIEGMCRGSITFELPILLGPGDYFLTLKLESHKSELEFYPVDKQVGVLSFRVLRKINEFLGPVDVGIKVLSQQQT